MTPPSLIRVTCMDKENVIGITNYTDMVAYDQENTVVAMRFGGYPETVQAMSDAMIGGCNLELIGSKRTISVHSKQTKNYERRISHDGIYAECIYHLKDDTLQSLSIGDDNEESDANDAVDMKRNLYFFCENDDELFAELDRKLAVPLIPEFRDYFIEELCKRNLLEQMQVYCLGRTFQGYHMYVSSDEQEIVQILEDGLRSGRISITGGDPKQNAIFKDIASFTQYLRAFGSKIVERIKECFPPLYNPAEEPVSQELTDVNQYIIDHAHYSLFDAQLGAAEALRRRLEKDKLVLLVAECGTGKTKIGSAALYAYQHGNSQRRTSHKAFNVVICPSHITEKWVRELHESIPNCFAKHVTSITDVDQLYNFYRQHDMTVYCILSKETARNGYMRKPVVTWNAQKKAFVCPKCGQTQETSWSDEMLANGSMDALFFRNENSRNHRCQICGEPLWEALNPSVLSPKQNQWIRIGGFGFIHRQFAKSALFANPGKKQLHQIEDVLRNPDGIFPAIGAYRRYPLSSYIKKKIHKIDALIIDELHQYSGESAQGQAMAELAGISEKVIGMTATLINGYAKGMFYLLWRLKANLMLLDRQRYSASRDFCQQYGVVEQVYETEITDYNASSKASKHKTRERFLPGISPIVYSKFLMENAVFLSLSDMGKELPDYEEIPLPCRMDETVSGEYNRIENEWKKIMAKQPGLGRMIMSSYMNLLSVYPDQPYGQSPICVPRRKQKAEQDSEPLIIPADIGNPDTLQPKDQAVIELIKQKTTAGERVIVYTAWTRLDTQKKLQKWLMERKIPTVILDQKIATTKREAWVDQRVREGVKVLIVNPALVETGLDLNAFTTLIFYNIAFNLYVFRQASRRSWRINQKAPKVEVYMPFYSNTIQQSALRLMATKLAAATVIEGNISDEGLAAMSDCNDLTTQLARELLKGIQENADELAESFKKMAITGGRHKNSTSQPTECLPDPTIKPTQKASILSVTHKGRKRNVDPQDIGQRNIFDLMAS